MTQAVDGEVEQTGPPGQSRSNRRLWGVMGSIRGTMTPAERKAVLEELYLTRDQSLAKYLRRFSMLLGLSVLICVAGLHANSTAVVIGAMLIAPLMEPILASAAAMVMVWRTRLLRNLAIMLYGAALTIVVSALLTMLVPERIIVPQEIVQRVYPTLFDLAIAIGAGAASAYMLAKRVAAGAAGVAVAVALVPPLCVVGILLERGNYGPAWSAFVLFATNLAAILLAAVVVLLLSGFTPQTVREARAKWIRLGILLPFLAIVLLSVPLVTYTVNLFDETLIRDAVTDSVRTWHQEVHTQEVTRVLIHDDGRIVIDMAGEQPPTALVDLADAITRRLGRDVDLTVRWSQRIEDRIVRDFTGVKEKAIQKERPTELMEKAPVDLKALPQTSPGGPAPQ